jgi:hypothetical protein
MIGDGSQEGKAKKQPHPTATAISIALGATAVQPLRHDIFDVGDGSAEKLEGRPSGQDPWHNLQGRTELLGDGSSHGQVSKKNKVTS